MLYQIDSDYLTHESKQSLSKILAEHYAGEADSEQRELEVSLRALADSRPKPDERVLAGVERDKTPYVPGIKRGKRTITLGTEQPTAQPWVIDGGTFGESTVEPLPISGQDVKPNTEPKSDWLSSLWERFKDLFA